MPKNKGHEPKRKHGKSIVGFILHIHFCLRKWRTGAGRGGKDCAAGAAISVERGEETATTKRRPSAPDDRTDPSA
jgi:hypothetical protein